MNLRVILNNKSNTNQAMWIAMGSLSSFGLSIVSAAILSRYFDKTEYGTYRQILYVYNTLLVIFSAGLPRIFGFYLPRYNLAQGKDIVWKITKVLFLAGFIFSMFLYLFSGLIATVLRNPELARGLKYFSPIPMLLLPTLGIEGIFSTYKQTIYIAVYNVVSRFLMLLFIVLPVILLKGSYLYSIIGWIAVSMISLIIAFFFKSIPFKGLIAEESGLTFKEIFYYSAPLAFASLAGIAIKSADQFYISRYFGTEIFAEFSNGFIQLPFVGMVTGATSTVLMPMFSKIVYEKSDIKQLVSIWQSSLQKSAIIIYPIIIFFIFFSKESIFILYSSKYAISANYFTIAMLINFFNVIVFAPLLLAMGQTQFYARLHLYFAIIAWSFDYLVVLIFKTPIVIAISSAFQSICIVIVALFFISRQIKVRFQYLFPLDKLFKIGIHSIISVIIVKIIIISFMDKLNNIAILFFSGVLYGLILLATSNVFQIRYSSIYNPLISKK